MITFENFTKRLAHGQLKNTHATEDSEMGTINPEYIDTILELTNQGLEDISMRKPILFGLVDLTFVAGTNIYPLVEGQSYLAHTDVGDFKNEDFVQVLEVQEENGTAHTVKTDGHILAPSNDVLRFTNSIMDEIGPKVRIKYQRKHAIISAGDTINIPPNYYTALQLFVASLYISHMGSPEHTAKGDAYFATYMRHLNLDELNNTSQTSEVLDDTRFEDRGFV